MLLVRLQYGIGTVYLTNMAMHTVVNLMIPSPQVVATSCHAMSKGCAAGTGIHDSFLVPGRIADGWESGLQFND